MDLIELKKWINEIPEDELGKYPVVFREVKEVDDGYFCTQNVLISACGIDKYFNYEIYFCNENTHRLIEKYGEDFI